MTRQLIKISGHELSDMSFLERFTGFVAQAEGEVIIVHGGGKEISDLQKRFGIEPDYIDGVRVTDRESLDLVQMVLCGLVNKRMTHMLLKMGVRAIGLSGLDMRLIEAEKMEHASVDMQFTGQVSGVNADYLEALLADGFVPVIAPICYNELSPMNVNADHVAGALAEALSVDRLVFLSNVAGVLQEGVLIPELSRADISSLIEQGVIFGGMIPKVMTAIEALENGSKSVMITDLEGLIHQTGSLIKG